MQEIYQEAKVQGQVVYHGQYCLYNNNRTIAYSDGAIRCITLGFEEDLSYCKVTVYYADYEIYHWNTKWISGYNYQFGIPVSFDGRYVFVQTWEYGLLCLDARTGEKIWRTKSRRGITNVLVNQDTLLCHQREKALQLIDIHTGELIQEKKPATAWGFTPLNHKYIICQVRANRWEIIDAQTLETKKAFTHKDFTSGKVNFCIDQVRIVDDERIEVHGFQNRWDNSTTPPTLLPNDEFSQIVEIKPCKEGV